MGASTESLAPQTFALGGFGGNALLSYAPPEPARFARDSQSSGVADLWARALAAAICKVLSSR